MAGDLLEESVRGLPRGMARFPHIPADRKRPVFPPRHQPRYRQTRVLR
jgi:hypothetical protein